ncbi:MAG TPA: M1 family aminopeptidase [Candidatus Limnocylindrales bacterium]|nr:M1 family aminopeptidase [Candidatus Limnocylindrales bacterium]
MTVPGRARRAAVLAVVLVIAAGACASPTTPPATDAIASPSSSVAPPTATPTAAPTTSPTARPTPPASPTLAPTPPTAIVAGVVDRSSLEVEATYDATLDIAVASGAIHVGAVIAARNVSGEPIDRLDLNTIAARLGRLDVKSAAVDDRPVEARVDDQTITVPLGGILPDGAATIVKLSYTATLRAGLDGSDWLFTRSGGTLVLYRWIPWLSRPVPFDRPNHGDPFVTPSSQRVRVRVTTDVPMTLASPGAAPVAVEAASGSAWSFEVADVRDAAVVLAPDFRLTAGAVDGVEVRAYTRGGLDGARLVAQAKRALDRMADRLGVAYPWPAFTIVETRGGYGMESPGLILVPRGTAAGNLPYLVHHETAHQWFYGLVGNDQQAEPFADEAAADLLARTVLGALRGSRCDRAPLDRSIVRYSQACYYEVVYIQGGNVLDDLREAMGTEPFWSTMGAYVEANRHGLAGTRQLLEALRAASPVDLLPTLRARFPDLY